MCRRFLALLLSLAVAACGAPAAAQDAAPPPALWSPAAATAAAAADAATLPADVVCHVRYLDIGWLESKERPELIQVLSGHTNSLSRRINLRPPKLVPGTLGGLLRVDLRDYGIDPKVWERLFSPYNHVPLKGQTADWPGGVWQADGKYYAPGAFKIKAGKEYAVNAIAPWQGPAAGGLAGLTQSQAPIVNGLWWLWQTVVQEGRGDTGYYNFLGIKDEKTFEELIRFDAKLAQELEKRRVVIFSGVTQEPRRVERLRTVLGGYWRTFDSAVATGDKNPIALLNGGLRFDATERFAPLPNGIPVWYLADGKGKLQSKAPDTVVRGDRFSPKSPALLAGLSCWRCHAEGKADNVILGLDHAAKVGKIFSRDYRKVEELQAQYLTEIKHLLDQDRVQYAAAIKEASGLDPQAYAAGLSKWYRYYDEAKVDLVWAARDLATTPAKLQAALKAYPWPEHLARAASVLSVVAEGDAIGIRQWEEVVEAAWLAVMPPPGGKK